eukprot:SAG11_NODE_22446_length_405_cov_49.666667_1_plen_71_part_01
MNEQKRLLNVHMQRLEEEADAVMEQEQLEDCPSTQDFEDFNVGGSQDSGGGGNSQDSGLSADGGVLYRGYV